MFTDLSCTVLSFFPFPPLSPLPSPLFLTTSSSFPSLLSSPREQAEPASAPYCAHSRCSPPLSLPMKEETTGVCMHPPIKTRLVGIWQGEARRGEAGRSHLVAAPPPGGCTHLDLQGAYRWAPYKKMQKMQRWRPARPRKPIWDMGLLACPQISRSQGTLETRNTF